MDTYSAPSLYSAVNIDKLEVLRITEPDDAPTDDKVTTFEDIEDPKWLEPEHSLAYPPNPRFMHSYECYIRHMECIWTANENDPSEDMDKFAKAPIQFQRVMLNTAACIITGDSVVLDKLHLNVTPANVRVMLESQIDRENTHQIVYSRWCDISPDGDRYRSAAYRSSLMHEFEDMVEKYATDADNARQTLYFIMLCENIMFAPMFATINYCATKGYAPKICNANLLVMRDEYIHYVHARGLLASFRRKLRFSLARRILEEFCSVTMRVYEKIIGDYDDGFFNRQHIEQHFRHIVHSFMVENSLYRDEAELRANAKLYSDTPAKSYMLLPRVESKINLMESVSTVYMPPAPQNSSAINMSF